MIVTRFALKAGNDEWISLRAKLKTYVKLCNNSIGNALAGEFVLSPTLSIGINLTQIYF